MLAQSDARMGKQLTPRYELLIYARVSTDIQAEKDLSLSSPAPTMRQYAKMIAAGTFLRILLRQVRPLETANRPALRELPLRNRDHQRPKVDVVLVQ